MAEQSPKAEPDKETPGFSSVVPIVASSVTLAASILGTVGVSAGIITALLRNELWPTILALAIAWLGVLLGVASVLVRRRAASSSDRSPQTTPPKDATPTRRKAAAPKRPRRRPGWEVGWRGSFALLSLGLFSFGVFWLVSLAAGSLKSTQRPVIVATVLPLDKPAGFASLEATVTASGMSTDERYFVNVLLLDRAAGTTKSEEIFVAYVGGDSEGKLDYKLKLAFLPRTEYPWGGISAQLQPEGQLPSPAQTCGLPNLPTRPLPLPTTPPTSPTTLAPGTTCTLALVPLPTATGTPPRTA